MKISKKTVLVFTLVCLFLIGLAVPSYSWTRKNVQKIEKFYNSKLSPIIMIPGSSATENRFDGLVAKLNQDRQGTKHSLLKVKIWNDGRMTYSGSIDTKDNEPIIVIGFENNKDGYSNIKKQANIYHEFIKFLEDMRNKFDEFVYRDDDMKNKRLLNLQRMFYYTSEYDKPEFIAALLAFLDKSSLREYNEENAQKA